MVRGSGVVARFDHAVVAARDREDAIHRFRSIGFDTQPGGRHESLGTKNAIVRFGFDCIELLSVYDEVLAVAGVANRALASVERAAPA